MSKIISKIEDSKPNEQKCPSAFLTSKKCMELQINAVSGKAYEGRNQVELQVAKENRGFKSNEWLTFLQAKEKGLKIKEGSSGVSVFKGFGTATEKDKDGKIKNVSVPMGFARVFNLDQTEKYETK